MKRVSAILLTLLLSGPSLSVFSAAQPDAAGKAQAAVLPMRYVVPGNAPDDLKTAMIAVNEKLAKDKVPINVEVIYIPWDAWDQRTNIMLSTGEPFELIHVMENVLPSQSYAARGALTPLDELIDKYGQNLKKLFTAQEWDALRLAGKIYAVPARWQAHHGKGGGGGEVSVRLDLLKEAGLELPKTPKELLDAAEKMQQLAKKKYGETFYIWHHNLSYSDQWFFRTLDTFPFYVDFSEEIIMIDGKSKVSAFYESQEFKANANFNREMYTRGLRHPDVLSLPNQQRSDIVAGGKMLFGASTGGYSSYMTTKRAYPEAEILMFYMKPDMPIYESLPVWNSNSVPSTTKNPETAIQFLDWLYKDKTNHDLFMYGVPGVHYEPVGTDRMKQVLNSTGKAIYGHQGWQAALIDFNRWDVAQPEVNVTYQKVPYKNVRYTENVGFIFDKSKVKTELANVLAERQASMWPIKYGIVPYDAYYADGIKRMKAAGLDRIVEEYAKQYAAWKATKK
jgi:putative aldouronate transport system substrate-binding protein